MSQLFPMDFSKILQMKANQNDIEDKLKRLLGCFQWFKDTEGEANHNNLTRNKGRIWPAVSMVQRY